MSLEKALEMLSQVYPLQMVSHVPENPCAHGCGPSQLLVHPRLLTGMRSRKGLGSVQVLPRNNRTIPVFPTPNPTQIPNKFQLLGGKLTPAQKVIFWWPSWARKSLWNVQKSQMMDFIPFGATMRFSKGKQPWKG